MGSPQNLHRGIFLPIRLGFRKVKMSCYKSLGFILLWSSQWLRSGWMQNKNPGPAQKEEGEGSNDVLLEYLLWLQSTKREGDRLWGDAGQRTSATGHGTAHATGLQDGDSGKSYQGLQCNTAFYFQKKGFKWWALLPKTSRCQCVLSKENHSCILSCPAPSKGATGSRTPQMDPTGPGDVSGSGSVCEKQDKKDICSVDN